MPSTLSILVNVFPPDERTKAIAIWAGVTGAAGVHRPGRQRLAARPLLVRIGLPRQRPDHPRGACRSASSSSRSRGIPSKRSSTPSAPVLSIVGISSLVYGLIQAPDARMDEHADARPRSPSRVVVLAVFVLWELHVDEPMLDMRYFRNPRLQHRRPAA